MTTKKEEELPVYRENFDYRMKPVVEKICDTAFPQVRSWDSVKIATAVHHYIYNKVSYESRGSSPNRRRFRPPTESWHKGGNCEEQTVMLASLFASINGVESKVLSVANTSDDYHLLVFAGFDLPADGVKSRIKGFYSDYKTFGMGYDSGFSWQNDSSNGVTWFFADPEFCVYLGDTGSLKRDGYVVDTGGGWKWHKLSYEEVL